MASVGDGPGQQGAAGVEELPHVRPARGPSRRVGWKGGGEGVSEGGVMGEPTGVSAEHKGGYNDASDGGAIAVSSPWLAHV